MTEAEHFRQRLHQPVAADRPVSTRIEQSLEVAFEVRQANLAATVESLSSRHTTQVSRVTIRDDGTGQRLAVKRDWHHRRPFEFDREKRERRGHHRPNSRLPGPLFNRHFVAVDHGRGRQRGLDLIVTRLQGNARSLLLLDHPHRAARITETANRSPTLCGDSIGGTAHQHRCHRDESRAGHMFGDSLGRSAHVDFPQQSHVNR